MKYIQTSRFDDSEFSTGERWHSVQQSLDLMNKNSSSNTRANAEEIYVYRRDTFDVDIS